MEENKFKNGKSKSILERLVGLLPAVFRTLCILAIILFLSLWIWMILFSLSIYIGAFLQVFTDFYTRVVLQHLKNMFVMIVIGAIVCVVEAYCSLTSKKYEKNDEGSQKSYFKPYLLSFYITFLLLMPFVIHFILYASNSVAFPIYVYLVFFVFVLLKICLKNPVLDILFLIWSLLAVFATLFVVFYLPPGLLIVIMILIPVMLLFKAKLLKLPLRKGIKLNAPIKATKESVKEKNTFLKRENFKENNKIDPFYDSEFQHVNKIYLLVILTLTLFAIGTIFIADFTHVEEYSNISQSIELCEYNISPYTQNITPYILSNLSPSCTPHPNNTSFVCSLYHRNIFKDNLTLIKSGRGNHSFYPIDTFCTQYDQHRKDFITYFSTLIVATITFFVMMYEKFIRRKEKKRRHRKKLKNKR